MKNSLSIKIGKFLIWILGTTLVLIEIYERLANSLGLDGYTFILILLCIFLILSILEVYWRFVRTRRNI